MSPLTRLYVGVTRAWVEAFVLCVIVGYVAAAHMWLALALASVLALFRIAHAAAATAGAVSLHQSARERINRGRDHHNRS